MLSLCCDRGQRACGWELASEQIGEKMGEILRLTDMKSDGESGSSWLNNSWML